MKTKELKNIASKIAKCERILRASTNDEEIYKAQLEIMNLSSKLQKIEDIDKVDEMVQDILASDN